MSTEVRLLAAAVLSALIGAATAGGAQTKGPSPPPSSFRNRAPSKLLLNIAALDGKRVRIGFCRDPRPGR